MLISHKTMSGGQERIFSRASLPFLAVSMMAQSFFSQSIKNLIPDKIMVSSSTIKQLYIFAPLHISSVPLQRDMYGNPGEFPGHAVVQKPVLRPVI